MAVAVAVTDMNVQDKYVTLYGTITPSGSYATGGDTLNITGATLPPGASFPLTGLPVSFWIYGQTISGYVYSYVWGTTNANGKLGVQQNAAGAGALAQIAAAAYPAGVTSDVIRFEATYRKA